jgi:hypothetical protein
MPLELEIRGLADLQAKTDQMIEDLHGEPMLDGMRTSTVMVSTDAKVFSPVDTGLLRSSITPEVRLEGFNVLGVVGSVVFYAPFQETLSHFLQRAFDKNLRKIKELLGDVVSEIVDK